MERHGMSRHWTTETSEIVLSDRWIHVRRERVTTGRGTVLDPYYVLTYPDWAVTVAITPADEVVMVRQYRHGTASVSLELPGGCVDPSDATPLDAALRELREESGYGGGHADYIGGLAANPALQTNRIHVATLMDAVKTTEPHLEPGEDLSVELVPVADALRMAESGGMEQSMHVAALYMGLARLGRLGLKDSA